MRAHFARAPSSAAMRAAPCVSNLSTESSTRLRHRSVTAENCRAAADATALVLALAVDAEGDGTPAEAASSQTPTAPSPRAASPGPAPAGSPRRENAVPATDGQGSKIFSAGVYVLADLGTLPVFDVGAGVRLGVTPPFAGDLRFEVGANLWMPESISAGVHDEPLQSAVLRGRRLLGALLRPLGARRVPGRRARLDAASGSSSSGVGRRSNAFWPIARARFTSAYRLGAAWAIRADLGVGVSIDRPEFSWEGVGAGDPLSPAVVAARGVVGVDMRF